jgi:hypothetical protein
MTVGLVLNARNPEIRKSLGVTDTERENSSSKFRKNSCKSEIIKKSELVMNLTFDGSDRLSLQNLFTIDSSELFNMFLRVWKNPPWGGFRRVDGESREMYRH